MGIILGLAAALGWGTADFLVRHATLLIGPYCTLLYMQFLGLAVLTLYMLTSGTLVTLLHHNSWQPWVWLLLVAILNTYASLALYRAFTVGVMMIVSPITSAYAAITVLLSLLSGEKVELVQAIGMAVVLFGVVLTATALTAIKKLSLKEMLKKWKLPPGIGMALLSALGYGVSFWLLGFQVTPHLGGVAPTWIGRIVTPLLIFGSAPLLKQPLQIPRGRQIWGYLTAISIFDTAAFVFYGLGLVHNQVSVVSILASLYGAVTVVLAFFFLKERLHWNQVFGIGVIFVGVVLVSI